MPQSSNLQREIGSQDVYDFGRIGSFGRFQTGQSYPVDYVMTTFLPAELCEHLDFARDIKTTFLDFELMMQRDIDEDRVRYEMEPYLSRTQSAAPDQRDIVFFPPLLAAIVPVEDEEMLNHYSEETIKPEEGLPDNIIREWYPFFRVRYFKSNKPDAYEICKNGQSVLVNRHQVELQLRRARGMQKGSKLVVIDGQHRLLAIKRVYESEPGRELLKNLVIPVCIVFPAHATTAKKEEMAPVEIQTVPQVFRSLFVDVNETMEKVGGHFTILLGDNAIADLACRIFCDYVLKNRAQKGLAVIEWNIKSRKDSFDINRGYSLTSIGVINKALGSLLKSQARLAYLLNFAEVQEELHPEDQDVDEYPRIIKNDSFSISQQRIIEEQLVKQFVPGLDRIFFEVEEFRKAYDLFLNAIDGVQRVIDNSEPGSDEGVIARKVRDNILDYRPIPKRSDEVLAARRKFERELKEDREGKTAHIIGYQLFQRAVVDSWANLLDIGAAEEIPVKNTVDALLALVNSALRRQGEYFLYTQPYMQHSVFVSQRIKAKEATRKAVSNLIDAQLGNNDCAAEVAAIMVGEDRAPDLTPRLRDIGLDAARSFGSDYLKTRMATFKTTYPVDLSLDDDEREALALAEQKYKRDYEEWKRGEKGKDELSGEFDRLVRIKVEEEVSLALNVLKENIGLEIEILVGEVGNSVEDED